MAYLMIEKNVFEAHCPFGVDVESDIYNNIEHFFTLAYDDLTATLLGKELGELLPDLIKADNDNNMLQTVGHVCESSVRSIRERVYDYVCNRAMWLAIPSLDLVLTNNGFGVVNARDIIPAVPERVNRLRQQCGNDADSAYDFLLCALPAWIRVRDTLIRGKVWLQHTEHLVWTANHFQKWCARDNAQINRNDLNKASGMLTVIESQMEDMISSGQMSIFRSWLRGSEPELNSIQSGALDLLMAWLSEAYSMSSADCRSGYQLMAYMDKFHQDFEPYRHSEQYAARHHHYHQTTRKSGCFIFR